MIKVELNEDYVHDLRRERMKKHRRTLTGSSAADLFNSSMSSMGSNTSTSTSPMKSHGPASSDSQAKMKVKDTRSFSLRGYDHSASPAKSPGVMTMPMAMDREGEREGERERHRRADSTDSTRFQVKLSSVC